MACKLYQWGGEKASASLLKKRKQEKEKFVGVVSILNIRTFGGLKSKNSYKWSLALGPFGRIRIYIAFENCKKKEKKKKKGDLLHAHGDCTNRCAALLQSSFFFFFLVQ